MKLASLSSLLIAAARIFRRFPAAILSSCAAAAMAIHLVGKHPVPERSTHLLMVAALGIALFIALRLFWEKSPWGRPLSFSWVPLAGGVAVLFLYWMLLNRDAGEARYLRYFQIALALHLAVALAPFLERGETNGFWQFNRRLFLRFFLSAIYAAVFYGGLVLALLAVDNLFDIEVNDKLYPRLWLFTVFVFQTWHFLGGVPESLADLDADREHPKALQIFSKYMLVPLVVLYVGILYTYMGKILLTRQWPQGWVGWLVSYAAVFGVLTLLLLHPGRQETENRWVERFGRAFYAAVLPLLGLLFAALSKRVGQYGMTELRHFLLVLGLWLAGISLYMLFSAAKSIKIVPLTLGLTALVTACGPWGAYQVSVRSQGRRLESLLTKHGLLSSGKIVASRESVDRDDLKEICGAVDYLVEKHGAGQLNRWDSKDWSGVAHDSRPWERRTLVGKEFLAAMGLEYVSRWGTAGGLVFYDARDDGLEIAGYDLLVPVQFNASLPAATADPGRYSARLDDKGRAVEILKGSAVLLTEPLDPMLSRLPPDPKREGRSLPPSEMSLVAAGPALRVKVCFASLTVSRGANIAPSVEYGSGYLLIDTNP